MSDSLFERARAVFDQVCEARPEDRATALTDLCGSDDDLRREVESLLVHDASVCEAVEVVELGGGAKALAEFVVGHPRTDDLRDDMPPPERVGPYRVRRQIGAGGMGVIYEAEQDSPRRLIALKMLRPGTVNTSVLKRFRHEAQVLGHLQHPGIAQVYEAGLADLPHGRQPFIAMELVNGEPLDVHANTYNLASSERLELLARVCDAVQHAHQKSIIHRDLKPSNVLVVTRRERTVQQDAVPSAGASEFDGLDQPKVLDFGIARATDADLQVVTVQTEVGQLVGTLAYMAPEQVAGHSDDLDTRCDVYALGVMLYKLLTGEHPHDLTGKPVAEAARIIREEEPATVGEIDKSLRGDIETIVAKAMEKDRERRYASAAEFAADIRRFLVDQPIEARPASTFYQLSKFAKRNKGLVAGLAATFAALLIGLIGTGYFLVEARTQRNIAIAAGHAAQREKEEAIAARMEADQVVRFQSTQLSDIDVPAMAEDLRAAMLDAVPAKDRDALRAILAETNLADVALTTLEASIFERSIRAIDTQFGEQPRVQTRLLSTLASTLRELGMLTLAEVPARRTMEIQQTLLGNKHEETLFATSRWAELLIAQGRFEEAEPIVRGVYEHGSRAFGLSHPNAGRWVNTLGTLQFSLGQLEDAEATLRNFIEYRQGANQEVDSLALTESQSNLGAILLKQKKLVEAEVYLRAAYEARRIELGEAHPETLESQTNLCVLLRQKGEFDAAESLYLSLLAAQREVRGATHPSTLQSENNLASLYYLTERPQDAADLFQRIIAARKEKYGPDHAGLAGPIENLASCKLKLGDNADAEALFREALAIRQRVFGPAHRGTLLSMNRIARLLVQWDRSDEAVPLFLEVIAGLTTVFGADHQNTRSVIANLSDALEMGEAWQNLSVAYAAIFEHAEQTFGEGDTRTMAIRRALASVKRAEEN